jgi:hypothetical protein
MTTKVRLDVLRHYGGEPPKCLWCGCGDINVLELDHTFGLGNYHRRQIRTKLDTWLRREGYPAHISIEVLCHECHTLKTFMKEVPMPPANGKVGKHYSFRAEIVKHIQDEARKQGIDESLIVEDAILAHVEGVNGQGKHILGQLHQRHTELIAEVKGLKDTAQDQQRTMALMQGQMAQLQTRLDRMERQDKETLEVLKVLFDAVKRVDAWTQKSWIRR